MGCKSNQITACNSCRFLTRGPTSFFRAQTEQLRLSRRAAEHLADALCARRRDKGLQELYELLASDVCRP